jgi:hypothetical protein
MIGLETIEKISKRYSASSTEFIKFGSTLAVQEKKRNLQIERLEILARYNVLTPMELKKKIEDGNISEHPAWEDFIELKNIDAEIQEIDHDIRTLQEA